MVNKKIVFIVWKYLNVRFLFNINVGCERFDVYVIFFVLLFVKIVYVIYKMVVVLNLECMVVIVIYFVWLIVKKIGVMKRMEYVWYINLVGLEYIVK